VHIRRLDPTDEREFLGLARASKGLHRPWSHPPTTSAEFRELVGRDDETNEQIVVCRNDAGGIAGYFGLGQIYYGHFRSAYLGYYAFHPFEGQGYMREGLELLLRHAFGDLRLHRVQASIQPENERSIALVRAAGFRYEGLALRYLKIGGRWRDHEHWAITVEDRQQRREA
jgi:[ribosomal protein S5]-alanine N-acetyltransferase